VGGGERGRKSYRIEGKREKEREEKNEKGRYCESCEKNK
jgi:hypothetical protein